VFRKDLQFNKEFLFIISKKLIGFCVTIPFAIMLRSYWALLAGIIAMRCGGVILSYVLQSYRPHFSLSAARELFHFSKWLLINNILFFLRERSVDFIVGKLAGIHALGVFGLSYEISSIPTTELVQPVNRAVFPGYAKLSAQLDVLREGYLKVVSSIALFVMPAGVGLVLTADLVVPVLLGAKWMDVVPVIKILALCEVLAALQTNSGSVYLALGKPRVLTMLAVASVCLMFPLVTWLTWQYGIAGTGWGLFLTVVAMLPVNYTVLFHVLELRLTQLARVLWRPATATAVMWVTHVVLQSYFPLPQALTGQVIHLMLLMVSGAVVYGIVLLSLWRLSGKPPGAEHFVMDRIGCCLTSRGAQRQECHGILQTAPDPCADAHGVSVGATGTQP
jgi:O-antigen/teichoic acid export membrane protein